MTPEELKVERDRLARVLVERNGDLVAALFGVELERFERWPVVLLEPVELVGTDEDCAATGWSTSDAGRTWYRLAAGLPPGETRALAISPDGRRVVSGYRRRCGPPYRYSAMQRAISVLPVPVGPVNSITA